jgi:hypothetical protein
MDLDLHQLPMWFKAYHEGKAIKVRVFKAVYFVMILISFGTHVQLNQYRSHPLDWQKLILTLSSKHTHFFAWVKCRSKSAGTSILSDHNLHYSLLGQKKPHESKSNYGVSDQIALMCWLIWIYTVRPSNYGVSDQIALMCCLIWIYTVRPSNYGVSMESRVPNLLMPCTHQNWCDFH